VTTPTLKLSRTTGPAVNTTTVISVTGAGFKSAAGASLIDAVEFQSNATCNATKAGSGVTAVTTKSVVSATSMVITTPSLAAAVSGGKAYLLCVYTTTPALVGAGTYTVYAAPTVTARSLTAGPTSGGQTVSIDGTKFTQTSTVTVGGVAATGVKVNATGTSITFVTPKMTAGNTNIRVTTEGGQSATGAGNAYSALNAVTVSPKTGVVDGGDVITVTGAGFDALDFTAGANNAAVMFVPGVYAKATHGVGGSAAAALCTNVQVVSDTQLVCTTPDMGAAGTDGAYIVTVVKDKDTAATTPGNSVVSSSAAFTFAAF